MDTDLIKLVNKLQDTFSNLGGELDMPQLVVVGSQSAGKSSVLENIVGRDFLPRGQGIVTRRPLVLQLVHTPEPTDPSAPREWARFLHIDKKFTSFEEIRKEIEQETFRVAGQNKGISKLPISLRISSPDVLDLTLVDLPGLTKIPVGDQPSDIEKQIRNLVVEYITKPNSVILAVSPANVDLANSESLKLARSVDPQGRRTIGVLTKLDLMDAGTNALDILTGRVYPLKLGFIGVVNRSQLDINAEKSMKDALVSETEYFQNHPVYRNIAHKNGTRYLAKTLNSVLLSHIRDKLPDMKARLNTLMTQTQQELNSFGDSAAFGDANQQGALVLRLMTQFARDFVSSIEGTSSDLSTKELSGGARIYYIFNDVFGHALHSIDAMQNLDAQDIRTVIRNSTGPRPSLFIPEMAFSLLIKPQIKLLEAPSLRCVELVYEELVKICHTCTSTELQGFPKLHAQLVEVISELLRERLAPTTDYARSMIDIQVAYINTNHPAFVAGSAAMHETLQATNNRQKAMPTRPTSVEPPVNGIHEPHEEDENASEASAPAANGSFPPLPGASQARSVSANARTTAALTPTQAISTKPHKHSRRSEIPPSNVSRKHHHTDLGGSDSSPTSARDTFLNYFFGQNGPGPIITGSTSPVPGGLFDQEFASRSPNTIVPSGRDVSGSDPSMSSGLMANKRTLDGNNTAYDMKSLGRHIEVASPEDAHLSHREEKETTLIQSLITLYFSIVRQTIQDLVPKAIMHLLVNNTSQQVQNRLVSSLYKPELFSELLNEDEALVAERTRVKALLDAYKEAFKTLSDVNLKSS